MGEVRGGVKLCLRGKGGQLVNISGGLLRYKADQFNLGKNSFNLKPDFTGNMMYTI